MDKLAPMAAAAEEASAAAKALASALSALAAAAWSTLAALPLSHQLALALLAAVAHWLLRRALCESTHAPLLSVPAGELETADELSTERFSWEGYARPAGEIPCYDPATMRSLGTMKAMTRQEVQQRIARAREAQQQWAGSSFAQRRKLLRVLQRFIVANQATICRVAARDSGKPLVDAAFGEVLATCEKIAWLIDEGERWLRPESRSAGRMVFYKRAWVEWRPVGVMGAIVPWNYPFHNVFNPLVANLFAGNALVVKVSEHGSWSSQYYSRVIEAALEAAGAPKDLVQIVTGYGEAGEAVVTGGCDKVVFVGSTTVGRMVMKSAAQTLTPVVLELGGKDPFIVCDDADFVQVVPTALRGAFQSCGQNCAGAERFYVHERVHERFVREVVAIAGKLRQGPAVGSGTVDCGAMCMPQAAAGVHALVQDAVAKGAVCHVGGQLPEREGQFYPPTVLSNVDHTMRIMKEEVFGPVLSIVKVRSDEEAVALANDCDFGLGSNVFTESTSRGRRIAKQLNAGMSSVNDFCVTYMCQSLPFGGVKESGFDRFAGVEGLRGCCNIKSYAVDVLPFVKTYIPAPLQYPVSDASFAFCNGLCELFYGAGMLGKVGACVKLLRCIVTPKAFAPRAKAA